MTTQNPSQPNPTPPCDAMDAYKKFSMSPPVYEASKINPNLQFDILSTLVNDDVTILKIKDKSYGSSWRKRGGIGAYMMAARKWDRLEEMLAIRNSAGEVIGYQDMFIVIRDEYARGVYDNGAEPDNSFLAQLRDLRRYLGLIDSWTFMNSPPTTPIPDDDIRSLKPGQIAPYDPLTGKIGPKRPAVSDGEGADNPYTANLTKHEPADPYVHTKPTYTSPPLHNPEQSE